ncbi:MAG TPA: CotH kinase family protein [Bacteroidales bacterium]|nr:CotH kinase family protein [Bacteroidales bacterium]
MRVFLHKFFVTLLSLLIVLPLGQAVAQTFTSSNLPIVIINTDINPNTGQPTPIPDEPKVPATMKIIYRPDGSRNYMSDQNNPAYLNYNGRIGIETRGSTSQMLPKKPYGLTTRLADDITNNNVSILGMPSENDWILNALAYDPSLIRDFISYKLSENIGTYATRVRFCEVVVNGDYKGLYIFMEKIKTDTDRLNLVKLTTADNSLPAVSGGYITKADKTTGGDPVAWTMPCYAGANPNVNYIHDQPKPSEITQQQHNYIKDYFTAFQTAMTAQNASIINGFPSMIDVPSFVDFILLNEYASNADAYQYSTFFHKDRGGKLRAGPIWDMNLTYGNDLFHWGFNRSHTNVWQFNYENRGSKFWKDLFDNSLFRCYMARRWNELSAPGNPLSYSVVVELIDQTVNLISEAAVREQQRWGTVGNHQGHIYSMKSWIMSRINWLNTNLSGFQVCATPTVPQLVISRIHYHPKAAMGFSKDDLEFIEITNNSAQLVDLSGIYLREPGISYQFPPNSTIAPGAKILLASNAQVFQQFYGLPAFGQYTRYLSNKSYKIQLADAWGNTIDEVHYFDSAPWPPQADGNGPHLKLIDVNLDNSLPQNWMSSNEQLVGSAERYRLSTIRIAPNPATSVVIVTATDPVAGFELYDASGRLWKQFVGIENQEFAIDLSNLPSQVYMLKVFETAGHISFHKLVKH